MNQYDSTVRNDVMELAVGKVSWCICKKWRMEKCECASVCWGARDMLNSVNSHVFSIYVVYIYEVTELWK
jgi:hypothetical protein